MAAQSPLEPPGKTTNKTFSDLSSVRNRCGVLLEETVASALIVLVQPAKHNFGTALPASFSFRKVVSPV